MDGLYREIMVAHNSFSPKHDGTDQRPEYLKGGDRVVVLSIQVYLRMNGAKVLFEKQDGAAETWARL